MKRQWSLTAVDLPGSEVDYDYERGSDKNGAINEKAGCQE